MTAVAVVHFVKFVESGDGDVTSTQGASRQLIARVAVPVVAAALALAVGAILIAVLGANPAKGLAALGRGAFGGKAEISRTVLRAVPMMLVASGICIAFRASVINIGGEGQMVSGALAVHCGGPRCRR